MTFRQQRLPFVIRPNVTGVGTPTCKEGLESPDGDRHIRHGFPPIRSQSGGESPQIPCRLQDDRPIRLLRRKRGVETPVYSATKTCFENDQGAPLRQATSVAGIWYTFQSLPCKSRMVFTQAVTSIRRCMFSVSMSIQPDRIRRLRRIAFPSWNSSTRWMTGGGPPAQV